MTQPGILRERLLIEAPVDVADDAGGVTRGFAPAAYVWAAVTPVEARPLATEAEAAATVRHRVTLRAGPELTTRHRLRRGARVWRILSVRDADASGRFLLVDAEERVD